MRSLAPHYFITLLLAGIVSTACPPPPGDLCAGIDCGDNGHCVAVGGGATCECVTGHHPEGLTCVPDGDAGVPDGAVETCGNGIAELGEMCDGQDLRGETCVSLGGDDGILACRPGCSYFDTSGCVTSCGDGFMGGTEQCDGADLGGATCESLGYYGGALTCTASCTLDLTACAAVGRCGDGDIQTTEGEECDETNLDGETCDSLGFYGGTLACDPTSCLFDVTICGGYCGDGLVQTADGETCDSTNMNGETCLSQGFTGGILTCQSTCQSYNTIACTGTAQVCGTNIVETGEDCDDGNLRSHDGCSSCCTTEEATWEQLTPATSPPPRHGHKAVFDSRRRRTVVFGGSDGTFNDETWEFDGNDWSLVSTSTAPTPRHLVALAYDSSRGRVLLYGGYSPGWCTSCSDSWEFNGVDWTQLSPGGSPSGRSGAGFAFDELREVSVLFGGVENTTNHNDTWEYNGVAWSQLAPQTSPAVRQQVGATFDPARGVVTIYSGWDGSTNYADTWDFDGTNWTETTPAVSPPGRRGHQLVYDPNTQRVVLFGGNYQSGQYYADTWEYDGTSWTQTTPGSSPTARNHFAMAFDENLDGVLLYGGITVNDAYLGDTWLYRHTSSCAEEVCTSGTDDDGDGLVDCADPDCTGKPCSTGICRGTTCESIAMGNGYLEVGEDCDDGNTTPGDGCDGSGQIEPGYFCSGQPSTCTLLCGNSLLDTGELCDGALLNGNDCTTIGQGFAGGTLGCGATCDAWVTTSCTAPVCGNGVVEPGEDCDDGNLRSHDGCSSCCTAEAPTWEQLYPTTSPPARTYHAATYDSGRRQLLLFGGTDSLPHYADTWEYDGAQWMQVSTSTSPSPRVIPALTYDASREVSVLFGGGFWTGSFYQNLSDMWEYDGSDWIQVTPAGAPSARRGSGVVFDPLRSVVVLFGGADIGLLADTWEYDGSQWTLSTPGSSPPARSLPAAAYDASRNRIVLFGGACSPNTGCDLDDTWEYDGTQWVDTSPLSSPPARRGPTMAYLATVRRTVLFGGYDGNTYFPGTWEYDGTQWVETSPANPPPPRYAQTLTYDESRGRVVLFGGNDSGQSFDDTWEYYYNSATCADEVCDNSADDDGDGLTDCEDQDCAGKPCSTGICRGTTCEPIACGNGYLEPGEQCDDGNTSATDGCDAGCQIESGYHCSGQPSTCTLLCGNAALDPGELCDGALLSGNDCTTIGQGFAGGTLGCGATRDAWVTTSCTLPVCGNGVVEPGEDCDDGNLRSHDGCSSCCTTETPTWEQVFPGSAPHARHDFGMAYDSDRRKIVLFGGHYNESVWQVLNDTWEFDGLDWAQVTTIGSPPAVSHPAIAYDAVRKRTVLFGGQDAGGVESQDTFLYDGSHWDQVDCGVAPPARYGARMAFDENRGVVVLFGGIKLTGGIQHFGDTWEFDGSCWSEQFPTQSAPAREAFAMAYDPTRAQIVLYGGSDSAWREDVWEYNGATWTEVMSTSAAGLRNNHDLVYHAAVGRLVTFGGHPANFIDLDDTWELDGASWNDTSPASSPSARAAYRMAYFPTLRRTFQFGGYSGAYNELGQTWAYYHASATCNEEICDSGSDDDGDGLTDCADPDCADRPCSTGVCRGTTCEPIACGNGYLEAGEQCDDGNTAPGDGCDGSGQIEPGYSCSGQPSTCTLLCGNGVLNAGELCDGALLGGNDCTTIGQGFAGGTLGCGATCEAWVTTSCTMPVCGNGAVEPGEDCDDGNFRSHDGCSSCCTDEAPEWVEVTPASSPPERYAHSMAFDAVRGRTVLFGGYHQGAYRPGTWEYDGATWTNAAPAASPSARVGMQLAFHEAEGAVVAFGGYTDSNIYYGDTWEYNGTNWIQGSPAMPPHARNSYAMTYDAARGRTVIFGGYWYDGSDHLVADSWEYDGVEWAETTPGTSPTARHGHALGFDSVRNRSVLFGGLSSPGAQVGNQLSDTWEYDGTQWASMTPTSSPAERWGHKMAFDSARGRVVLFGGAYYDGTTHYRADTWEYDGTTWVETSPTVSPPARIWPDLAYDDQRDRIVLFGGSGDESSGQGLADTWEYRWNSGTCAEEICDNGGDEDGDGLIDCADPDCAGRQCATGWCLAGGVCGDPCAGVTCSGQGTCAVAGSNAWCDCNTGYHAVGLTCVENAEIVCGSPVQLASTTGTSRIFVDATGVYWTDWTNGFVYTVPHGGGTPVAIAPGQSEAFGLVGDGSYIYFTTSGVGDIKKVPVGGGAVTTMASLGYSNYPLHIRLVGSDLYWDNPNSGTIKTMPVSGGTPVDVTSGLGHPYGMAVDSTNAYWTCDTCGTVGKAPLSGGSPVILASGQTSPYDVAVDATNIYWNTYTDGTVMKLLLSGGTPTALASGYDWVGQIEVDSGQVYFAATTGGTPVLARVPASGGAPTELATGYAVTDLFVYGSDVYFLSNTPSYAVMKVSCVLGDPCDGVTCSGQGTCASVGPTAQCECDVGFHAVGLTCVANWTPGPTLTQARGDHSATLLNNGEVLIAGGWYGTNTELTSAVLFDPVGDTFGPAGSMADGRFTHPAVLLPDGKVLVAGGANDLTYGYEATTEVYDPLLDSWSSGGLLAEERGAFTMTILDNDQVLAIAGVYISGAPYGCRQTTELFDYLSSGWTGGPLLGLARHYHTATRLIDGRILVTGGGIGSSPSDSVTDTVEICDASGSSFSPLPAMSFRRHGHSATRLVDGRVLVVGGLWYIFGGGPVTYEASAEIFDPGTDTWLPPVTPMPSPRHSHKATLLPNGEVLVTGGTNNGVYLDTALVYNPSADSWRDVGSMSVLRSSHSATLLQDGRVLIVGGRNAGGPIATSEILDLGL
ncbi:MAG: kelch repeat-containing protein [bacterium]